jgi:nickel-dependent lactate racemase
MGKGVTDGYLSRETLSAVAREGLGALPVDGRRVLVIIPDGTRTMPMPAMFELIERELGPRVAALDYLVALGTHAPMSDGQLTALVGRPVVGGRAGARRIFNHRWDDPATYAHLGTIPAREIADLTGGSRVVGACGGCATARRVRALTRR